MEIIHDFLHCFPHNLMIRNSFHQYQSSRYHAAFYTASLLRATGLLPLPVLAVESVIVSLSPMMPSLRGLLLKPAYQLPPRRAMAVVSTVLVGLRFMCQIEWGRGVFSVRML